ncbi:EAL domain-containing protein (putative c-di-GMP-specific phosphodiesterase class I) [Motilibacter rhizosphaerae]|uniref:EAL domain-containing protein (Putative c-di-GMP-specific phosphodiesterase class I) n=1 Tax=Motilibacter rhizosphaerae TaxID=598652 RepID=A0A4Q7NUE9_9ACTN|nr:EAL domain-containing protein [Motilibacter rhizosphaerae]RZS90813.1 EAL domain-containing protein (putative c-di-GMP-specific phosphodiesterase class I) [Motilibacter rhizosphaerae]
MTVTSVEARAQVETLLATARQALGVTATFLSRMDGQTQRLEQVDSSVPLLFQEGYTQRQDRTLCQAVLDGDLPAVMPDLRKHPLAMTLPAAKFPRLRSYISVPVVLSDGSLYGTFCGAGLTADRGLSSRDKALMDVLARAAAMVLEPELREQERRDGLLSRFDPLMADGGPRILLQPIVALADGRRTGAEALSRFPVEWGTPPDVAFEQAHSVGVGDRLELLALRRAAGLLDSVDGYVSLNVSPSTLITPECRALLHGLPVERVLLELTEHDAVQDYDTVRSVLEPLRRKGLRLAIDDVGAGFSSLRHIVLTSPDVLKLDRSIIDGIAGDTVLRTLVASLVTFAHACSATLVAEGIERAEDAVVLRELGVDSGQGWYFGRPVEPAELAAVRTVVAA